MPRLRRRSVPRDPRRSELVAPVAETHAIQLSPRGRTRRQKDRCTFPPLRVEFAAKPATTSLFERPEKAEARHTLPSVAAASAICAARICRLSDVQRGQPPRPQGAAGDRSTMSKRMEGPSHPRLGFFIEDPRRRGEPQRSEGGDGRPARLAGAARSGRRGARGLVRIYDRQSRLVDARRLRWATTAATTSGSSGQRTRSPGSCPFPTTSISSGFVNAPYARARRSAGLSSVRDRQYRGYCMHNAQAHRRRGGVPREEGAGDGGAG